MAKYLVYAQSLASFEEQPRQQIWQQLYQLGVPWCCHVAEHLSSAMCADITSAASWALGLGVRHREAAVTFVVKQLPTYYTQEMFVSELVESGFKGQFDLLYIPCHPEQGCNIGYAIVNFTQPEYAEQFRASFPHKSLDEQTRMTGEGLVFEPAPTQGSEANCYHFALKWSGSPPLGRPQLCPLQPSATFNDLHGPGDLRDQRAVFNVFKMPVSSSEPHAARAVFQEANLFRLTLW